MRVSRFVPGPAETADLTGEALDDWLRAVYDLPGRWLRLNLITALGGEITGPSGRSDDLADGVDRPLLKVLRGMADVVLVGAASVRAEGYTLPRRSPLAVVTASGDLRGNALPASIEPGRLLVLCPPSASATVRAQLGDRATVVEVADPVAHPASIVDALRTLRLSRIVCEGGGRLASRLVAAGVVTEFCHTIAPVLTSPGAPLTVGDVPLTHARLVSLVADETDRLYARWGLAAG